MLPLGRRSALLGALLSCLVPCACGPTRHVLSRAAEPSAVVKQMSAQAFDRQHADLTLEMELQNPGAPLAIASAEYEILAEGRSFATGTIAVHATVPAGGRASLALPVQLAYLDLPYAARNRARAGGRVLLVARGTLRGTAGAVATTIEFDGEAEVGLGAEGP